MASKARPGINMDVQMGSLASYVGAMEGVSASLMTERNIRSIAKGVQIRLIRRFDIELCAAALAAPLSPNSQGALRNPYEHVFEPGMLGVNNKTAKLWMHVSKGVGRERISSFIFRDSIVPILPPTAENTGLPEDAVAKLNQEKRYIFEKRAFIEEAGLETVLRPNPSYAPPAKYLVVPGTNERGYYFAQVFTYKRRTSPMKGTFGQFWAGWWTGRAPQVYSTEILPNLDNKIYRAARAAGAKAARTKKKTKNFMVLADTSRAATQLAMQAEITGWEKYVIDGDELNIFD